MFYTNKDNENYLTISKEDLYLIFGMDINEKLINESFSILRAMKQYSREHNYIHVGEVTIKKDNILAQFLLTENTGLINNDLEVDLFKTSNALSIAVFENNPISKEIIPLFKNKECGNKNVLSEEYNKNVINYILSNDDFNYYIKNLKGKYNQKFYVVYENGECRERKLIENNDVILTKKM